MKLTREQRAACFKGEWPRITYPGATPCPVEKGEIYWLSSLRRLVVTKIRRSKSNEWVVVYTVQIRDAGLFMASRSPRASTQKERDRFSDYQARGYTRSASDSLDKHAEAVYLVGENDPILVDNRRRFAEHRRQANADEEAAKDLQAVQAEIRQLVQRAVKLGIPPSTVIAPIAREIQAQHRDLKDAA